MFGQLCSASNERTIPMLNRYPYANDNPVRFIDPDGRQGIPFHIAPKQLYAYTVLSNENARQRATEQAIKPRSIIMSINVSAEGGYPLIGGKGQVALNYVIPMNLKDGSFAYFSAGATASGLLLDSVNTSLPSTESSSQVLGGDIGFTGSIGVTNMSGVDQARGTSTSRSFASPLGGLQSSESNGGAWSFQVSTPSGGLSYSKQDLESGTLRDIKNFLNDMR